MHHHNTSIWHKIAHDTAVKRTFEKLNAEPNVKFKMSDVRMVLRGMGFYIQALSREMVLPEHHKKKGGTEFIGDFGSLTPFYYVTLHHMYLNKEFTDDEWRYIRYEKYPKQFNNYFIYYDNKGKYIGKNTYHKRNSLEITRRSQCDSTKSDPTV